MRACRFTAAIAGLCLSLIFGTLEAIASTSAIALVPGIRAWAVTLIVAAILATCTLGVIERQNRILARLDDLASERTRRRDARAELAAIQRRLRTTNNVTTLHPEE